MPSYTHESAVRLICERYSLKTAGLWTEMRKLCCDDPCLFEMVTGKRVESVETARKPAVKPRPDAWRVLSGDDAVAAGWAPYVKIVEVWEVIESSRSADAAVGKWSEWWWALDSSDDLYLLLRLYDAASATELRHPMGDACLFLSWDAFDGYSVGQFMDFCRNESIVSLNSAKSQGILTPEGEDILRQLEGGV